MNFFDSNLVMKEIRQLEYLRELCVGLEDTMAEMGEATDAKRELATEYWHAMYALIDKQHVIYTRCSLSDDPEALHLKAELEDQARNINGSTTPINMSNYYSMIKSDIKGYIHGLTGEELDNYEGIDVDFEIDL